MNFGRGEIMDINSRVGNHTENMERAQNSANEFNERFLRDHPKFDFDASDFCHCSKAEVEATLEFDGFLRLTHVECGKILLDGEYKGETYMAPVRVTLQFGQLPTDEAYVYVKPRLRSLNEYEQDCGA